MYSNFGYCVLGRVIENVTGQSYLAYIRSEILAPLGINTVEFARSPKQHTSVPRPRLPVVVGSSIDKPYADICHIRRQAIECWLRSALGALLNTSSPTKT